jgi:hypothetical protein
MKKKSPVYIAVFAGALSMTIGIYLVHTSTHTHPESNWGWVMTVVPPLTFGGWWMLRRKRREAAQALETIFIQHLQENQGNVNAISFASVSKLSLAEAQTYLELKSNQLNSAYHIDDNGGVYYQFHLLNKASRSAELPSGQLQD